MTKYFYLLALAGNCALVTSVHAADINPISTLYSPSAGSGIVTLTSGYYNSRSETTTSTSFGGGSPTRSYVDTTKSAQFATASVLIGLGADFALGLASDHQTEYGMGNPNLRLKKLFHTQDPTQKFAIRADYTPRSLKEDMPANILSINLLHTKTFNQRDTIALGLNTTRTTSYQSVQTTISFAPTIGYEAVLAPNWFVTLYGSYEIPRDDEISGFSSTTKQGLALQARASYALAKDVFLYANVASSPSSTFKANIRTSTYAIDYDTKSSSYAVSLHLVAKF
jgi:hypothetical protein